MRELTWFEEGEGASDDQVRALEQRIGVKLPADYAAFLMRHAGSSDADESSFAVRKPDGERWEGSFGMVLSADPTDEESIDCALHDLQEQLPARVIPIIDDGGGDFLCLDYRGGFQPTVAYFAHEKPSTESVFTIARCFSEFLDMLYVADEE